MGEARSRLRWLTDARWGAALLVLVVLAVYGGAALRNGFVVDDPRFITDNPYLTSGEPWSRAFLDPATADPDSPGGIVRPLRTIEFRLDSVLGGSAALFHLHSVLWHVVSSVLLLLLLRRLLGNGVPALLAALLWTVHPIHTEAVAHVSSRADVAMGASTLAALLLTVRSRGRDRYLVGALVAGAVAMLYKETAIVLPVLVGAVRFLTDEDERPGRVIRAARAALPFLAVSVLYWIYRDSVRVGDVQHADYVIGGSTAGTFATMFRAAGAYLLFAVLPVRPGVDWYLPASTTLADGAALLWLAGLAGLAAIVVVAGRRGVRWAPVAWLLFFVPLIPVANWPFGLGIPTTERFLYLSLAGFALAVGVALRALGRWRVAGVSAVCLVAVSFALISHTRAQEWRDMRTLMETTLKSHDSVRANTYLGAVLREEGLALRESSPEDSRERLTRALAHLDAAIAGWRSQVSPWPPRDHVAAAPLTNAANTAFLLFRYDEAIAYADEAIEIGPTLPQPHYTRAWALARAGDRPDTSGRAAAAAAAMERALDLGLEVSAEELRRFEFERLR